MSVFFCTQCPYNTRIEDQLSNHLSFVHEGKKNFEEEIYNKEFRQKSNLEKVTSNFLEQGA